MTVVHQSELRHDCGITPSGIWFETQPNAVRVIIHDPVGTVRACECGRTYIAERPPPGLAVNVWRPEGGLARWWRERRSRGATR